MKKDLQAAKKKIEEAKKKIEELLATVPDDAGSSEIVDDESSSEYVEASYDYSDTSSY